MKLQVMNSKSESVNNNSGSSLSLLGNHYHPQQQQQQKQQHQHQYNPHHIQNISTNSNVNNSDFIKASSGVGVKYLFQSYQQQLDPSNTHSSSCASNTSCSQTTPHYAMSNEEARRLKG